MKYKNGEGTFETLGDKDGITVTTLYRKVNGIYLKTIALNYDDITELAKNYFNRSNP